MIFWTPCAKASRRPAGSRRSSRLFACTPPPPWRRRGGAAPQASCCGRQPIHFCLVISRRDEELGGRFNLTSQKNLLPLVFTLLFRVSFFSYFFPVSSSLSVFLFVLFAFFVFFIPVFSQTPIRVNLLIILRLFRFRLRLLRRILFPLLLLCRPTFRLLLFSSPCLSLPPSFS